MFTSTPAFILYIFLTLTCFREQIRHRVGATKESGTMSVCQIENVSIDMYTGVWCTYRERTM